MPSSRRHAVEVFAAFGWRAMTSKRRVCMKRLASSAWPSLKDGPRVTSMCFSAKHFQIRKTDRPMFAAGQNRKSWPACVASGRPQKAHVAAHVTHEAESAFGDHLAGRAVARFADAHDHRLDPSAIRQLAQEKDVVEALCSSRVGPAPGLRPQVPNKETTVA